MANRREKIVEEILSTEDTYVQSLAFTIEYFVKPLKEKEILDKQEISWVFSNIEVIYNLNQQILAQLQERFSNWSEEQKIGDVFLQMGPMLRMYKDYCKNYTTSLTTMQELSTTNDEWIKFLEEKDKRGPGGSKLPLTAYLIMPVQRIPRYLLLLSDLLKHTPEDHPDMRDLNSAYTLISEIAGSLNKFIQQAQQRNLVLEISNQFIGLKFTLMEPHRLFLKEGTFRKVTTHMIMQCYLFLFNDIILYSHTHIALGATKRYQYKGFIPLSTSWVRDMPDTDKMENIFQIVGENKTWTFLADDKDQKRAWISALNECIEELVKRNPTLVDQRGKVLHRQPTVFNMFSATSKDYDKEIQDEEKVKENLRRVSHEKKSSLTKEDQPLIPKSPKKPPQEKDDRCCACSII